MQLSIRQVLSACMIAAIVSAIAAPLEHGRGASAGDKLGRIASAVIEYQDDFDGSFPVGCGPTFYQPGSGGWVRSLTGYLLSSGDWTLVDDPKQQDAWPSWLRESKLAKNISFAANGFMKSANGHWGMYGVMGVDQTTIGNVPGWMDRGRTKESEVRRPSDTVMLAVRYGSQSAFGLGDLFAGVNWWNDISGVCADIPDGTRVGAPCVANGVVVSANDRNGGLNLTSNDNEGQPFAFADGHVGWMPAKATNPDPVRSSELNKWDIQHDRRAP